MYKIYVYIVRNLCMGVERPVMNICDQYNPMRNVDKIVVSVCFPLYMIFGLPPMLDGSMTMRENIFSCELNDLFVL